MNIDAFFDRVINLANLIEKEGMAKSANDLRDMIKYNSFVKTELFMGLRWHLAQVEENSSLSKPLKKQVSEMLKEVSQILDC